MPGKLCTGAAQNNAANLKNSKAYCEGIKYRASGLSIARPITDNPHEAGSEAADAWDLGWTLAEANATGVVDRTEAGCCAVTGTILA